MGIIKKNHQNLVGLLKTDTTGQVQDLRQIIITTTTTAITVAAISTTIMVLLIIMIPMGGITLTKQKLALITIVITLVPH